VLLDGGSALDAVEAAVRALEDEPVLNAGVGSCRTSTGDVEMDALIMDGASLALGAVAAITRVLHPISLARRVMSDTPHTFLAGEGASVFADRIGFPRCAPEDLIVQRDAPPSVGDTVGAVALDASGMLATAVSTGGIPGKLPGRVGDSPLVGSGAYANAAVAVGATGDGEAIMKLVLSKHVADLVRGGRSPQESCVVGIELLDTFGSHGGLIALDVAGSVGIAFNTAALPHAYAIGNDQVRASAK